jgi:hypothetical protein
MGSDSGIVSAAGIVVKISTAPFGHTHFASNKMTCRARHMLGDEMESEEDSENQ